jgi:hypothetical protein
MYLDNKYNYICIYRDTVESDMSVMSCAISSAETHVPSCRATCVERLLCNGYWVTATCITDYRSYGNHIYGNHIYVVLEGWTHHAGPHYHPSLPNRTISTFTINYIYIYIYTYN